MKSASVDAEEIAKLSAAAAEWWDPTGRFRPLHRLNPVRLAFIRDRVAAHAGRDPLAERPLKGLRLLDISCGGGLLAEPLARLGAEVEGIDASPANVEVAALHAARSGLAIDYRQTSAEALAEDLSTRGARFVVVVNLVVVEHVADAAVFLHASAALVRPGGAMVLATLNRTPKAFALAIVGAEYILGWLPRGTHDWRRFLRPSELAALLRDGGVEIAELTGVAYNPLTAAWHLARDLDVNYMVFAVKV